MNALIQYPSIYFKSRGRHPDQSTQSTAVFKVYFLTLTETDTILSQGIVARIEYDPNRSARIALVEYAGDKTATHYIIAPDGIKVINSRDCS